jgi:hypothetical protein
MISLNNLCDKYATNKSTKMIITQNVNNWLSEKGPEDLGTNVPDATKTLIKADQQQQSIGWNNWINGRWSQEWGTLQNYEIQLSKANVRNNTAENGQRK